MLEAVKKARVPATWLVLAGVGLALLGQIIGLVTALTSTSEYGLTPGELSVGHLPLVLGLVALNALWERTPRASALAWTAVGLVAVALLADLVFAVLLLVRVAPHIGALGALLQIVKLLVTPLVFGGVLWLLVAMARGERAPAPQPALGASNPAQDPHATTWQPDQAAGAAWSTASGAASGAGASGWGVPGQRGGWDPHGSPQGQPAQLPPAPMASAQSQAPTWPASQASAAPASQPSAQQPQIIYPEQQATDTTQFRGSWEPRR